MPGPFARRMILDSRKVYDYLAGPFRFEQNMAAPLPSPYTEPGAKGSLTITDTENKLSVSGGKLVCSGGKATPAYGDPGIWTEQTVPAKNGAAALCSIQFSTAGATEFGLNPTAANEPEYPVWWPFAGVGGLKIRVTGGNPGAVGDLLTTDLVHLMVVRSTAQRFLLAKINSGAWKLYWVHNSENAFARRAAVSNFNNAFSLDNLRTLDLSLYDSRFASDYGIATSRLVNPIAGATATHTPDALWEATFTHALTNVRDWQFRITDANNYWQVATDAANNLLLVQVTAGTPTTRGTSAGVSAAAHRVVCVAEGNKYTVYLDNVSKITYTDAGNQGLTATDFKQGAVAGGVAEVATWPRVVSLPSGV